MYYLHFADALFLLCVSEESLFIFRGHLRVILFVNLSWTTPLSIVTFSLTCRILHYHSPSCMPFFCGSCSAPLLSIGETQINCFLSCNILSLLAKLQLVRSSTLKFSLLLSYLTSYLSINLVSYILKVFPGSDHCFCYHRGPSHP